MAKAAGKNKQRSWYSIKNSADDVPEIFIYDEIGGWGIWASELIAQLNNIDAPRIRVRVFSPGGYVDEGIAIFNAFRKHPAAIDMEVDSLAASIATVVVMAGDTIRIAENARFMIHDPWGGAVGTAEEMRKAADVMDIYRDSIVATYAARTGIQRDEIESMMSATTWLTAAETVEMGFADSIDFIARQDTAQNSFSNRIMNSIKNVPEEFQGMFKAGKRPDNQMISPAMKQALIDGKPAELLIPLDTTSVGSGQRDQGHKKEEPTMLEKLKAQLKEAGVNIDELQAKADKLDDVVAKLETTNTELTQLKAAIGDTSVDDIKAALAARQSAREAALDSIVSARRALKMTGDSDDDVAAAKAIYAGFSDEQLAAEASQLKKLSDAKDQLKPDGTADDSAAKDKNKYINEEGE